MNRPINPSFVVKEFKDIYFGQCDVTVDGRRQLLHSSHTTSTIDQCAICVASKSIHTDCQFQASSNWNTIIEASRQLKFAFESAAPSSPHNWNYTYSFFFFGSYGRKNGKKKFRESKSCAAFKIYHRRRRRRLGLLCIESRRLVRTAARCVLQSS